MIDAEWEIIQRTYNTFADLKPLIEYDIEEGRIYAKPYKEYREEIDNPRARESLTILYEHAQANNLIALLIRDRKRQKVRMYAILRDESYRPDPSILTFADDYGKKARKKTKKKAKKKSW
jgi:hypothetical protein